MSAAPRFLQFWAKPQKLALTMQRGVWVSAALALVSAVLRRTDGAYVGGGGQFRMPAPTGLWSGDRKVWLPGAKFVVRRTAHNGTTQRPALLQWHCHLS